MAGFKISRAPNGIGGNPFLDMRNIIGHDHPIVFDVGANVGQSVNSFRSYFQNAQVHSFEPSPAIFQKLVQNVGNGALQHNWNCALGASQSEMELLENKSSEWNSFLKPGATGRTAITNKVKVPVDTASNFCREHGIPAIDILKSDTQGYDLEVFKGAIDLFTRNAVKLVYCEMIISELYEGAPSFGDLYNFLIHQGFALVSFYEIAYENGLAGWTDGLFVNPKAPVTSHG
jgi:FkbM family methyltransferase